MSTVHGNVIIAGVSYNVQIEIPTVRIPELSPADMPFDIADKFPMYDSSQNKTAWVTSEQLLAYLNSTGGTPITPVTNGSLVEIVITAALEGAYQVPVPALAGFNFALERRGVGLLKKTEYNILPSGGFELTHRDADGNRDDFVHEKEVFFARVFNYEAPADPTVPTSLVTGMATVSANTELGANHYNKLIHIASGNDKITITLPDIADAPDNLLMIFETNINNTYKTRIVGKNGQAIYFKNTSNGALYMGVSEYLWLYKNVDGWYVMKASEGMLSVGEFSHGYAAGLSQLVCDGRLVNRDDEPRLWEFAQGLTYSLVSETQWNTETQIQDAEAGTMQSYFPYKGCFSDGNGSTTFRLPDLQNQFVRGLNGLSDNERLFNYAGGIQPDSVRKHKHLIGQIAPNLDDPGTEFYIRGGSPLGNINSGVYGGFETRGMNVGLLPLIRT